MVNEDLEAGHQGPITERGRCAFCRNYSDYVLDVSDSAPDPEKVVEGSLALPICVECLDKMKEASL